MTNLPAEIDQIKHEIDRLSSYFENFELREPSSKVRIEDFRKYYERLTPEVIEFFHFCNGFNVNTDDYYDGNILPLEEHMELLQSISEENGLGIYQFPLLSDGCGNYDCIMFLDGIGNNSVVFWDSDYGLISYPKASSLSSYISFLVDDLIQRHHPDGSVRFEYDIDNPKALDPDWPFNVKKMILKDPNLEELYRNKEYSLHFDNPEDLMTYLD